jgi:TRAP-type C4-dicarboxylate transport system permease small subunit
MQTLLRYIHRLEDALLYVLVALLLGLSIYQIVARNAFDSGLYWGDPLLRVLVLWLAMVGAMLASREGGHIKIDVLSHYLGERATRFGDVATAMFSAAVCFVAAWYGFLFVADERQFGEVAFANVPSWVCVSIIPLGLSIIGLRFLLQSATQILRRGHAT